MLSRPGRDLLGGLLDLVFAPVCLGCGEPISTSTADRRVCGICWSRLRPVPLPRCDRCSIPRATAVTPSLAAASCAACAELPPSLRCVRSACVMEGPARQLVHALKYQGWSSLADPLGTRMASVPLSLEAEEEVRVVVPVPLSRARRRQRGYNQAGLLAEAVARKRGIWCAPDTLQRTRLTESQATLHPAERRANVAGAFCVPACRAEGLEGEHVLLVDDVWTTGATALACIEALIGAGVRAVSVLTFARALPELHR